MWSKILTFVAAQCNGRRPALSAWLTAQPPSSRHLITSADPLTAAWCRGVIPNLLVALELAPRAIKVLITEAWPYLEIFSFKVKFLICVHYYKILSLKKKNLFPKIYYLKIIAHTNICELFSITLLSIYIFSINLIIRVSTYRDADCLKPLPVEFRNRFSKP